MLGVYGKGLLFLSGLVAIVLIVGCPAGNEGAPPKVPSSATPAKKAETTTTSSTTPVAKASPQTTPLQASSPHPEAIKTAASPPTSAQTTPTQAGPTLAAPVQPKEKAASTEAPAKSSAAPIEAPAKESSKPAATSSAAAEPDSTAGKWRPTSGRKPFCNDWTKPALAIVLSGEMHGYMEPCGCSATQSGGLSRRADLLRQIGEKGWTYTALDLGGLVRKDNLQNKLKFGVMLQALKDLKYAALGLGIEELRLERMEPGFLFTQGAQQNDSKSGPSFVNANIEFTLFKGAGVAPALDAKVIDVGGHKVGVTSIFSPSLKRVLFGEQDDPQIVIHDPAESLPKAIASLKKQQAEILVLLAHAHRDESIALAKKFPEFQIVVALEGPEDGHDTPQLVGKTLLIEVGQKGKHVGIVGYYPDRREGPFRFELIDLDKSRFKDTPKMIDRMREYQKMLDANYDAVMADLPKSPHPNGDRYAGIEKCSSCHTKAYKIWKNSKHAHAYQSLISGRPEAKNVVPRNRDPECLVCHTTGWNTEYVFPYESGFYSVQKTPHLNDQQCENCHGPAAKHVELELALKKDPTKQKEAEAGRKKINVTAAVAEKKLCYTCHDNDNDPNFSSASFAKYWEQIAHPESD